MGIITVIAILALSLWSSLRVQSQLANPHQVANINNNSTPCDEPDNECSLGLTDRLFEIEADLSFARETISINRLSDALSLHMVVLEAQLSESLAGHADAQELITNSTNNLYNLTGEFVADTLPGKIHLKHDSLKFKADNIVAYHEKLISKPSSKRTLDNLELMLTRVDQLDAKSKLLSERIGQSREQLNLIENNFESPDSSHKGLVEIDSRHVRSLLSQAERYLQGQTNATDQFESIRADLNTRQVHMRELKDRMSVLCQTNGHFLVVERLFNLTATYRSPSSPGAGDVSCLNMVAKFDWLLSELHANLGQSYETLSMLTEFRQTMAPSDKQELLSLQHQQQQQQQLAVPNNASNRHEESPTRHLRQLLASSQLRLTKLGDQLNQTYKLISKPLVDFGNQSQETNLANLQLLANLTTELRVKGYNMTNWLQTELQNQSRTLISGIEAELAEYQKLTQSDVFSDWTMLTAFAQSVDDLRDQLYHINETMPNHDDSQSKQFYLAKNSFISNKTQHQIEWARLIKLNQTGDPRQDFATNLASLRQLVSIAGQDLSDRDREASKLREAVRHSREALRDIGASEASNNNNNSSPPLSELINEANKLSDLIQSSKDVVGDKIDLFRSRYEKLLDKYDALRARSPMDETNIREYLVGTNETGQPILDWASEQFDKLNSILKTDDLNLERVANLTMLAQSDIKQSLTSLTDKVTRIRSILNEQTSLSRNFTPQANSSGIWLKNPPELQDLCSTYTAVSFYLKPMVQNQSGIIIYLGNSAQDGAEFTAVELRHGKLALVSSLGSGLVDEIVDSNQITNNRWHHISVTRVGLLATISVATSKSRSSVTRSLTSPHIVLNFDETKGSVVLVSGLPGAQPPAGLHSRTGFWGQLDGLHLNGQRLGLWNTVETFADPIDLIATSANQSQPLAPKWPSLSERRLRQLRQQACRPTLGDIGRSSSVSLKAAQEASQPMGRLISFSKAKSNISSSFVQFLNMDYDELIDLDQTSSDPDGYLSGGGYIRRLTMRFRTEQANALLLHHSRPDHSTFMSIYITAGRLMVAINFDKKLRVESHVPLDDGRWHTLHVNIMRRNLAHNGSASNTPGVGADAGTQRQQVPVGRGKQVKHNISVIVDDRFIFRDRLIVQMDSSGGHSDTRLALRRRRDYSDQAAEPSGPSRNSANEEPARAQRKLFATDSGTSARSWDESQLRKVLYFGGVEDKYIPLLRNQQIPTNFHGCISDVTINDIHLNFNEATKNQGARLRAGCQQLE